MSRAVKRLLTALGILWASPWTLVGLVAGLGAILSGGGVQRRDVVIEFWGGWLNKALSAIPIANGAMALTLGHVVLGRSAAALDVCRRHERVHVRQYERWGPFFVPLYFTLSCTCRLRGKDPYRDNPFEREAFEKGR